MQGQGGTWGGGHYLFVWGGELIDKKIVVAIDGCLSEHFHRTTNQKHALVINNGTKERCEWQ
jgi:hypothetical protein